MSDRPPLLHPISIGAMIVLGLNDHVWKEMYGNWWTGKLSDVAGLLFFPLLLEYVMPSRRYSVLLTGLIFVLINLSKYCNQLWILCFQSVYDQISGKQVAVSTMDWTDTLVVPVLLIPLYLIPEKKRIE